MNCRICGARDAVCVRVDGRLTWLCPKDLRKLRRNVRGPSEPRRAVKEANFLGHA